MRALLLNQDSAENADWALMLNRQGIEVVPAHSLERALDMLGSRKFDWILADIGFAQEPFGGLCGGLKRDPKLSTLPVIFTLDKDLIIDLLPLQEQGYFNFVTKPLSKGTMMPVVTALFPDRPVYFKERQMLFVEADTDLQGVVKLMEEFLVALQKLLEAFDSQADKNAVRARFVQAQGFVSKLGTDALSALFQKYSNSHAFDIEELKKEFVGVQKQVIRTKSILTGEISEDDEQTLDDESLSVSTNQDLKRARERISLLQKQANGGDVEKMLELAELYWWGTPELRNIGEAEKWLAEASRKNNPRASGWLALLKLSTQPKPKRDELSTVAGLLDKALITGRDDEVSFWKAGIENMLEVMHSSFERDPLQLAHIHSQDANLRYPVDPKYAVGCLLRACAGDAENQFWLGQIYGNSRAFPQLNTASAYWLGKAADQGHLEAQYRLANLFQQRLTGYANEEEKALSYFQMAGERNHVLAQYCVAKMFHNGVGSEVNLSQARSWYEKAAKQGLAQAQYWLGAIYEETNSSATDLQDALKWYLISLGSGSGMATNPIALLEKKMSAHEVDSARKAANRYIEMQNARKLEEQQAKEALINKTSLG